MASPRYEHPADLKADWDEAKKQKAGMNPTIAALLADRDIDGALKLAGKLVRSRPCRSTYLDMAAGYSAAGNEGLAREFRGKSETCSDQS
jgi:hypothetical protein